MPLIQKIKSAIFAEKINGQKFYAGGLLPHKEDPRDFKIGIFGWGDYTPKHDDLTLDTPDIMQFRNTCTMASATGQKQSDENTPLNVRLHVEKMKQLGYVSQDGFSDLRSNQVVVQKYGIPEKIYADENVDDNDWERYSKYGWTPEITTNAYSHRSASFWATQNKNEILKLLDEGRVAQTGMQWYSGFNMQGGLTAPWIINKLIGYLVGGHAFRCNGYVKNYQGMGLHLRFKNSYGAGYGDKGHFYMPIDYALKVCYTFYFQLDIEPGVGKFLQKYEGKFVKANGKPAIYLIKDGTKRAFPDMTTYFSFGGARKGYELVDANELEAVPTGSMMDIFTSPYWPMIKDLTSNIPELVRVVNEALDFIKTLPNS